MEQYDGFIVHGQKGKMCKLLKSLYGLKRSPKKWLEKFERSLTVEGFVVNETTNVCTIAMAGVRELFCVCMSTTY